MVKVASRTFIVRTEKLLRDEKLGVIVVRLIIVMNNITNSSMQEWQTTTEGGRQYRYAAPDACDEVPPPHCLPSGRRIVAGQAGRSEAPCGKQAVFVRCSQPPNRGKHCKMEAQRSEKINHAGLIERP